MRVDEHTIELDSSPAFYRSAEAPGVPAVYLHGIPTSSDDWVGPLGQTGGLAVDLIGFGRTGKSGSLDYSIGGLAEFVQSLLQRLEVDRIKLVAHGWGVPVALELALGDPGRVTRMALFSPPALLDGFDWPRVARGWRTRGVGELMMGATNRPILRRALRRASATPDAWPDERVEAIWDQFDQGTQRAILRLHRDTDPHWVSTRAAELAGLPVPIALMWGERDPLVGERLAGAYAATLPQARVQPIADAGHWPWLDRPEVTRMLQDFLEASQ